MHESPADLAELQHVIEESIVHAGAFLRESFQMPAHSLMAPHLVRYLAGVHTVAFATTTARGEPRVAPTSALFYRGRFAIPSVAGAARTRHVQARPACSLTLYDRNDVAIIAHGSVQVLTAEHPEFTTLEGIYQQMTGSHVRDWGDAVFLRVITHTLYSYARIPLADTGAGR